MNKFEQVDKLKELQDEMLEFYHEKNEALYDAEYKLCEYPELVKGARLRVTKAIVKIDNLKKIFNKVLNEITPY